MYNKLNGKLNIEGNVNFASDEMQASSLNYYNKASFYIFF